ncbi:MAG: MFS transporter [Oscillospiraceae bacterium]|nr:MFS transporter [Oscillospiraceae bacterium]
MAVKRNLAEQIFGAEENSAAKMDPEKLGRFQKIAAHMYHTPQLSAKEVGTPAISKAGRQISDMINDTYRTFYFVSVLRLDMVYVTLILTLTGIFNVLIRPLMGIAYDRTRTRWGKARPYAIFAPAMYFGATALLFCGRLFFDNDITDDPRKILFVFSMMIIRDTFSLIYKVPVDNYLTLMTPNPKDRMSVGLWETFAKRWSGDFLAALIMPLLDLARHGLIAATPGAIFAGFGIVSAFIGTSGGMLLAINCPERIILQPKPAPIQKTLFYILKNKYMMRNFIADMAGSWWSKGGYTWDVVSQLEIFGGVLRTFPWYLPRQIFPIVSISFIEPFKKMFGGSYRKTIILMRVWDFFVDMVAAVTGLTTNVVGTWWKAGILFAVCDGINCLNDSPSTVLESEIGREISDYTEYMTGERPDGSIGILTMLLGKVTEPLKALVTIMVFKWSGYDPNIAGNRAWSQECVRENLTMYSRVFFLYKLANLASFFFNMLPMIFYDLEGKKKEDMYTALNERRALIAKQHTMSGEMAAMIEMMEKQEAAQL